MKIPIWAKDKQGKWQHFPTHLLDTLVDGSQGFRFFNHAAEPEKTVAFRVFRDYFEYNPIGWPQNRMTALHFDYRLRKQTINE